MAERRPRDAILPHALEDIMYRYWLYWLAAAVAIVMLGVSGCNRNEGMLPKTDGNQSSQAPRPDPGSKDTAGKAAPGGY